MHCCVLVLVVSGFCLCAPEGKCREIRRVQASAAVGGLYGHGLLRLEGRLPAVRQFLNQPRMREPKLLRLGPRDAAGISNHRGRYWIRRRRPPLRTVDNRSHNLSRNQLPPKNPVSLQVCTSFVYDPILSIHRAYIRTYVILGGECHSLSRWRRMSFFISISVNVILYLDCPEGLSGT